MKWTLLFLLLGLGSAHATQPVTVVFIGDSLTDGYGVQKSEAYPALIAQEMQKKGKSIKVINAAESGSLSSSCSAVLKWQMRGRPKVVVLALGSNDGLQGKPIPTIKKNLQACVAMAKHNQIQVLLVGMEMLPNLGVEYTRSFRSLYADIAKEEKIPLVPFLLEGVGGIASMNIEDGKHPNAKGHKRMAQTVLKYLEPLL